MKEAKRQLRIERLGLCDYGQTLERMRARIDSRSEDSLDALWLLEHHEVVTTGVRGRHLPSLRQQLPAGVSLIHSDRGGLATAHNPGQAVAYCLWRLERLGLTVPQLVRGLEECLISSLAHWNISAATLPGQPGVYVRGDKIASIGLRLRRGWCYHGLSVNVNNDLGLFSSFAPCGIDGMEVVSLQSLGADVGVDAYFDRLTEHIFDRFGFTPVPARPTAAAGQSAGCG